MMNDPAPSVILASGLSSDSVSALPSSHSDVKQVYKCTEEHRHV